MYGKTRSSSLGLSVVPASAGPRAAAVFWNSVSRMVVQGQPKPCLRLATLAQGHTARSHGTREALVPTAIDPKPLIPPPRPRPVPSDWRKQRPLSRSRSPRSACGRLWPTGCRTRFLRSPRLLEQKMQRTLAWFRRRVSGRSDSRGWPICRMP